MRRVLLGTFCVAASSMLLAIVGQCRGELLTFDYSGAVTLGGGTVFGVPIDAAATVTGQLKAETTAPMTHDFGNGRVGYHQTIAGGLTVTFDDGVTESTFAADEYLVIIGNDVDLEEFFADSVEFLFSERAGTSAHDAAVGRMASRAWRATSTMTARRTRSTMRNGRPILALIGGTADGNENGVVDAADYTLWRDGGPARLLFGYLHDVRYGGVG